VLWLLVKATDGLVVTDIKNPETSRRRNRRYRHQASLRTMEIYKRANVDIRNAVAIGKTERLITNIGSDPLDPAAGHRIEARVDESDGPAFVWVAVKIDPVLAEVDGDV